MPTNKYIIHYWQKYLDVFIFRSGHFLSHFGQTLPGHFAKT